MERFWLVLGMCRRASPEGAAGPGVHWAKAVPTGEEIWEITMMETYDTQRRRHMVFLTKQRRKLSLIVSLHPIVLVEYMPLLFPLLFTR